MSTGLKANPDGSAAIQVGGTDVIGLSSTGNINFPISGQRITGDFSNATLANRLMFQNSVTNGASNVQALPNGTGTTAGFLAFATSDPANTSFAQIRASATFEVAVVSGITGTGTYLPMTFYTGGSERMRIDTSGNLQFNSGYGSVATAYGCRAWVNFNGTGTVAIRASGNVSSITDNNTGDYTVNFTTAMPDANYSCVLSGALTNSYTVTGRSETTAPTTTAFRLGTFNASQIAGDPSFVNAAFFR